MARIRDDFVFGTLAVELGTGDTTLTSPGLERLSAITSPDVAAVTLYNGTAYEIVHVTAHTALADTATILRGQEGTAAQSWAAGDTWLHGPTETDLDSLAADLSVTTLSLAAAQAITASTWTDVAWDTEEEDTPGAWTSGASIVVPTGVTKARAVAAVAWNNSSSGQRYLRIYNATTDVTYGGDIRTATNEAFATCSTPWVSVAAGDSIRLRVLTSIAASVQGASFGGPSRISVEWRA